MPYIWTSWHLDVGQPFLIWSPLLRVVPLLKATNNHEEPGFTVNPMKASILKISDNIALLSDDLPAAKKLLSRAEMRYRELDSGRARFLGIVRDLWEGTVLIIKHVLYQVSLSYCIRYIVSYSDIVKGQWQPVCRT